MKRINEQRGVVLISVLVFLLLISLLVYTSLQRSIIEEKKVNSMIEYKQATELAYMALRDAENDITGRDYKGQFCGDPNFSCETSQSRVTGLKSEYISPDEEMTLASRALRLSINENEGVFENAQQNCKDGAENIRPLWQCVDWDKSNSIEISSSFKPITFGTYTGAELPDEITKPQYIIELFKGSDFGHPDIEVIARVTSIGFVKSGDNWVTSMLQATYSII